MPAVTPTDTTVAPDGRRRDRRAPARSSRSRRAVASFEGAGFPVRRPFPGALDAEHTDPFLMLDQMGPVDYAAGQGARRARSPAPRVRDRHLPASTARWSTATRTAAAV